MTTIDRDGLYEITAEQYHADPCPDPSLSNSLIGPLLDAPRKAWWRHPRLNPVYRPIEKERFDIGTVGHKLVLGRGRDFTLIVDPVTGEVFNDYRKKRAQELRDEARAAGKTPILSEQLDRCQYMVDALAEQGLRLPEGRTEIALVWRDQTGIWCRNLIDRITDDGVVYDYKTLGGSANPSSAGLGAHFIEHGYDTQCAFQERGLLQVWPQLAGRFRWRTLFQEIESPYLASLVEIDAGTMTIARKKVEYACRLWARCLSEGKWPAYPSEVQPLRSPDHMANRWLEREMREADDPRLDDPRYDYDRAADLEKREARMQSILDAG